MKIAPEYSKPVVHVLDASRAVDVVSSLLSPVQKSNFDRANRQQQEQIRDVNVDKPGRDDLAANVEHTTSPLGDGLRDSNDRIASNRDIGLIPGIARSIDDPTVAEQQIVGRALGTREGGEQDRNERGPRHYRSPCGLAAALVSAFQRIAV